MKFDTSKFFNTSGYYRDMGEEALAFHNALGRRIYGDVGEIGYIKHVRRRNINTRVIIDRATGRIRFELLHRHTKDKAVVNMSEIQSCLDDFAEFIGVCCDYGYLLPDVPEGGERC